MSGYIGTQPVPQATQTRDAFTATSNQTSFATSGYTPNFLDVFLNGVKLAAADYTASNGSDVVLATGATTGDILEVVAYTTFDTANVTGAADFTVTGSFTSQGIDDNANSTAITIDSSENVLVGTTSANSNNTGIGLTQDDVIYATRSGGRPLLLNRQTSDGDIAEFRKDGSTVGSIKSAFSSSIAIDGAANRSGLYLATSSLVPRYNASNIDATVDLGATSTRFKDLYLSGGVFLGGTGSANKLTDYEFGSWTPSIALGGLSVSTVHRATYVQVGQSVSVACYFTVGGTGDNQQLRIGGLPYASASNGYSVGMVDFNMGGKAGAYNRVTSSNTYTEVLYSGDSPSTTRFNLKGNQVGTGYVILSLTYHVA